MGDLRQHAGWLGDVQPVVSGQPVGASVSWIDDDDQSSSGAVFHRRSIDPDLALWELTAPDGIGGLATGTFADIAAGWRLDLRPAATLGVRVCGFQGAEFAFPARASRDVSHWPLLPHRPATMLPILLIDESGAVVLLAAIDGFHEQIGAVGPARVDVGWHGDLRSAPPGWTTRLAVVAADGATAAFERWAALVDRRPRSRYVDSLGRRLSYWTDNGAAYWYRTEPGHTVTSGLTATVADLAERDIPIETVQLDSWWYVHETLRPFDTDEWVVPPSGMLRWEPRDDILPDGLAALRDALGHRPLAAHCRHLSAASPYVDELPCWVDGEHAHPSTPEVYERLLDECVAWGIETLEHDWLVECFNGVRQLREAAGRADEWLGGIDAAAADRGITLQWCMATPAAMAIAAALPRVTSVRTSGDHGYIAGPGFLWAWFLVVNRMARALGLWPYKDVFWSSSELAPVDACLSVLSGGPVGIGDPLGAADPTVLRPCHRADGLLVKPDVPIAALDRCFGTWPFGRARLLAGECTSTHAAGTWHYVLALNPDDGEGGERVVDAIPLHELGVDGDVFVWDWRAETGTVARTGESADIQVDLAPHDWALWVLAPLHGGVAVVGDPSLYATAGDRRLGDVVVIPDDDGLRVTVVGAPGEAVELVGWDDGAGIWRRQIALGDRGWATAEVTAGSRRGNWR